MALIALDQAAALHSHGLTPVRQSERTARTLLRSADADRHFNSISGDDDSVFYDVALDDMVAAELGLLVPRIVRAIRFDDLPPDRITPLRFISAVEDFPLDLVRKLDTILSDGEVEILVRTKQGPFSKHLPQ